MTTSPRVRFAPSPTGMFHVGGARTALFNWLFVRRHGGTFVLRIEDTDNTRNHPEWTDMIYRSFEWLGLDWDDTYPQSRNLDAHRETALKLHADGHTYYCDCTPDALQKRKAAASIKTPGYDSFCSDRDLSAAPGRALRFRVPEQGTLTRADVIRGTTDIDVSTIEDFVILRGDGSPLYLLANAHDDVLDGITHVSRSAEHLSNTEKQILLRRAMGHQEPVWAHVPMIVNEKGKKLSKRHDKVALEDYRDEGYISEAMLNYLATLGWSPPSEYADEQASLDTMTQAFAFEDVTSSSAQFDVKKLASFNGDYIRRMSTEAYLERSFTWLRTTVVDRIAPLLQERAERLPDTFAMVDFLVHADPVMDLDSWQSVMAKDPPASIAMLEAASAAYADADLAWTASALKEATEAAGASLGLKLNKAQAPVRVAVAGRRVGPPLFESLELLGRMRTLARVERALDRLRPA
ncbi:MAG TPA: glutamate--tRNA ligase [Acidimicrobiales bacterium]